MTDLPIPPGVTEVIELPLISGRFQAIHRMLWESTRLGALCQARAIDVYLTFSHFLPANVTVPTRIVGVSNLAPFSEIALRLADPADHLRLRLLKITIIRAAKRATSVIALSKACKERLAENGVDAGKVVVISNGSDSLSDPPIVRREDFMLCVSHFYTYKNFELLVKAFAALPRDVKARHPLLIVGPPIQFKYFQMIQSMVNELSPQREMQLIAGLPRDQLSALYARCAVFVFPSLVENCPNVLLEAMSAGCACLVSDAQPMPEFGGNAVSYFDPQDHNALTKLLAKVLNDAPERLRLGSLARIQVGKFTWDKFVQSVVAIYRCPATMN